ncbi:MAG: cytochrome c3 family protein [Bacillota bacterium]
MKRLLFVSVLALMLVFSFAALAMAAPGDLSDTVVTDDVYNDNGVNNVNNTGVGVGTNDGSTVDDVLKSVTGQRTHGEYQKNTNSCASCHQTHTAAAKSLLFKDGVFTTCTACHDGTLGFFNVFENGNHKSSAGTFGGDAATGNPSVHFASGAMTISAAPGGYKETSILNRGGNWTGEFNCASCHSPHGSYSDRLLHYNPNGMANTKPEDGGLKVDRKPVVNFASLASQTDKFVAVRGTKAELGLTTGYEDIPATDSVIMIYQKSGTSYVKTTNPWMYGYPVRGTTGNNHYYYTRLFTADPATILNANGTYPTANAAQVVDHYDYLDGTAHLKYAKGLIYGTSAEMAALTYAEIARNYVVKLDLLPINATDPAQDSDGDGYVDFGGVKITTVNQRALWAGETHPLSTNVESRWGVTPGTKVSGWGVAMSTYCSACHTDYLGKSGAASGTFETSSYRHTTNSDSYTCVRCHFAHGTDAEIMRDAKGRSIDEVATEDAITRDAAKSYMLDQNASSALKRYTNMSVCWACHTSSKAEQLKNTDSYSYPEDPRGLPETEGKYNWPS